MPAPTPPPLIQNPQTTSNLPSFLAKKSNPAQFDFTKVFAAIGIILTVIILVTAGVWYFVEGKNTLPEVEESTVKVSTSSASQKTATESSEKDETKNWKVYTNSKYKYSFKHPANLEVSSGVQQLPGNEDLRKIETTAVVNVGELGNNEIQVTVVSETKTLEQVKQDLLSDSTAKVTNMTDTKITEVSAIEYKYNGFLYVTTVENGYRYEIYLKNTEISKQILSTFKFL